MADSVKTKPAAPRTIAVIGNPNTGKSTLFNALTGLKQHVGNYPGVTVERKVGTAQLDEKHSVELIDLPGTYSLAARSPDEMVAVDILLNQLPGEASVDAILAIADASNPERNFYLISQLLELGLPVVVALNMLDVAETKGIVVDTQKIGKALGVTVVGICANKSKGLDELKTALLRTLDKKKPPSGDLPKFPAGMNAEIDALLTDLNAHSEKLGRSINHLEAFRALVDKGGHAEERLVSKLGAEFKTSLEERRKRASTTPLPAEEVRTRYAWVKTMLAGAITRPAQPPATRSDAIDKWVTHWFSGSLIFIALMFIVFECIFSFAQPVMDVIKVCFDWIGACASKQPGHAAAILVILASSIIFYDYLLSLIARLRRAPSAVPAFKTKLGEPALLALLLAIVIGAIGLWFADLKGGPIENLIVNGIIKGVGAVLVFLPQIALLFLFIAIMEDCGYMARAAFLMDRLLSRVGLSGKSFIPMLSSFACAVPGIMATRTIENWRDRLTTILVAPLMSCSARLPIYTLMILAFIPAGGLYFSWMDMRALTLFAMYFVGMAVAIPVAFLLKKTLLKGETPPFLIELPSYKIPDWRGVGLRVLDRAKAFIVRAGTIILAVSVVVWALTYFPHPHDIGQRFDAHREMVNQQTEGRIEKVNATLTAARKAVDDRKDTFVTETVKRTLIQAEKYDVERDKKLSELAGTKPGVVARLFQSARIEASHVESLKALSEVPGIQQLWPQALAIREAKIAQATETREAMAEQTERLDALNDQEGSEYLRASYFARMGKFIEPAFKPLGWDWRISMAALASFPAREVIVATLGNIFYQGEDAKAESVSLQQALQNAEWDRNSPSEPHRKLFNISVALSIMVFFALCSQCAATLATIKRETNSWTWPVFSFTYMTMLAYLAAMATYQIGMRL